MDPHVRRRGPFRGEVGNFIKVFHDLPCYSYTIRTDATGEVVAEGYAGDLREAIQTVDLYLDYFVRQASAA
jgi:hypothetical protein